VTERSVTHATFTVERVYPASAARVFAAWATAEAKARWADDPDYLPDGGESEHDFRVGGRERFGGKEPDGPSYRYDAVFYDIVPGRRIVFCYEMYSDGARVSVSVATVDLTPAGGGTRLVYTEQGAFLDGGRDGAGEREQGVSDLLDNLLRLLRDEAGQPR
jgi:uncharacterized protein YndB with AHSA1/START domain